MGCLKLLITNYKLLMKKYIEKEDRILLTKKYNYATNTFVKNRT